MTDLDLIYAAKAVMKSSYSPYSGFRVGAALLCDDDRIFIGTNIENASFSATVCAERAAFFDAVENGAAIFKKIAIVGGTNGIITDFCYPCGVCKQVIGEFAEDNFEIILFDGDSIKSYTLGELNPFAFKNIK